MKNFKITCFILAGIVIISGLTSCCSNESYSLKKTNLSKLVKL